MPDSWAIFRREFRAFVRSRAYVLGTLFGPLMIALFFVLPVWFMSGGGDRHLAIVDGTGRGLGDQVSSALREPQAIEGVQGRRERIRIDVSEIGRTHGAMPDSLAARYRAWVAADSLDGFLWLPAGVVNGSQAHYLGEDATSFSAMGELRSGLQRAVQLERLRRSGIDAGAVGSALRPVRLEVSKPEGGATAGTPDTIIVLAQFMGFVAYFLIILYGYAVAR
ncbi:MAG TPA: hypothetical protein VFP76_04065, partial [Gemmatimonadota bacterium]|nr:hypothetical protein [Gemmatimonadota bacterium]